MFQSSKLEDVATKCDHIVGFVLSEFPQYGEQDGLIRMSDNNPNVSLRFNFCPVCGVAHPGEDRPSQKGESFER